MAFNKKNGKTMSGFLKIRDFFKKSVLRKTAEFSVSGTGDPLILTCLVKGACVLGWCNTVFTKLLCS